MSRIFLSHSSVDELKLAATLADLLTPSAQRPQNFWRGYDVYDQARVGFVVQGPAAVAAGTKFDTQLRGNSSGGHDFGTGLSDAEKSALIEYLKSL